MFVIFISEFENTQKWFSCGSPFGHIWSVKYFNLWPKATNSDSSWHKVDTLRFLKIYFVFSTCQSQIPIFLGSGSWTIIVWFSSVIKQEFIERKAMNHKIFQISPILLQYWKVKCKATKTSIYAERGYQNKYFSKFSILKMLFT